MQYTSDLNEDVLLSEDVRKSLDVWTQDVGGDDRFVKTVDKHRRSARMKICLILVFVVVAFVMMFYSIQSGPLCGSYADTVRILWDKMVGSVDTNDAVTFWTLYDTPPVLGALIGGAGLAICGAIMQSTLRNPMADPYTTGISSGASFGAAIAIASGSVLASHPSLIVMLAFVFSLIPVLVILGISKVTNTSPVTIIMTGIGIMYIFNALTSIVRLKAGSTVMTALDNWLMGDVQLVEWSELFPMGIIVVAGIAISMWLSSKLNVLATGDDNAKAMGINADALRVGCLVLTAVVSAGVISFTGLIGFVGLVCPHIARMVVGADNRYLIPASAAMGSALMVVAHFIGKQILSPTLVPVGIIMSCVGGPVFIWLVIRKNKNSW